MRVLRCWLVWSIGVVAGSGCFGGFEQQAPPSPGAERPRGPATRPAAQGASAAASAAKKPQQSYAEAWRLICDAERRSGVDPALGRNERGTAVAEWIVAKLINKQARYWFIGFGKVKEDRKASFLAEARRAGLPRCPLAALLFAGPPRPAPPSTPAR